MNEIAPKSINIFALPSLPFEQKNDLPDLACVYLVLSSSNEVLYVGRSKNLCKRWKRHHCRQEIEKFERVKITWLTVDDVGLLPSIEKSFIEYFEPLLNFKREPVIKEVIDTPLKKLREKADFEIADVRWNLGVSEKAVYDWEQGSNSTKLSLFQFTKLVRLYKCDFEDLAKAVEETITALKGRK